jgi:hypothetical protein
MSVAAHVPFEFLIRHLQFLHKHRLRFILADDVKVIAEVGPIIEQEIRRVKAHYRLIFILNFNFESEDNSIKLCERDVCYLFKRQRMR